MTEPLLRRLVAEIFGTAMLLATIVGSGIMGETLAGGNAALALLGNTLPTGAMLVVLILVFGPVSGAHFNPVVTLAFAWRTGFPRRDVLPYVLAQVAGALMGVAVAHAMFDLPLWQISAHARTGTPQWLSEAVATLGLLITIFGCLARDASRTPFAVGLYITAAYWFTASTSFANPAVTLARAWSDTFAGIAPFDVLPFVLAQFAGMLLALALAGLLWPSGVRTA